MSTNTSFQPYCWNGLYDVAHATVGTITVPGPPRRSVNAATMTRFAEEPLFTATQYFVPQNAAYSRSNSATRRPIVVCPLAATSRTASSSCPSQVELDSERMVNHLLDHVLERDQRQPADRIRLARIAAQALDLQRPTERLRRPHELAVVEANVRERHLAQVAHRPHPPRRQHVVARQRLHQHPHAPHVVPGVPPIARRVEVPQHQLALRAALDRRHCPGHLLRHEPAAAADRLVVAQAAVRGMYPPLPVVPGQPGRRQLRARVRAARAHRALLVLRRGRVPEQLARARLVHLGADPSRCVEAVRRPGRVDLEGARHRRERIPDVGDRRQVVDLVRPVLLDQRPHAQCVRNVPEHHPHAGRLLGRLLVAAAGADHLVAMLLQELRQIPPVLPADARDQRLHAAARNLFSTDTPSALRGPLQWSMYLANSVSACGCIVLTCGPDRLWTLIVPAVWKRRMVPSRVAQSCHSGSFLNFSLMYHSRQASMNALCPGCEQSITQNPV